MPQTVKNQTEVGRLGEEIYTRELKGSVETPENIGQLITIDVDSHDFEIGSELITTARELKVRRPRARVWAKRIGYNAVFAIGGTLKRTGS